MAGVETAQAQPHLRDHSTRVGRIVREIVDFPTIPMSWKRRVTAEFLDLPILFPHEVVSMHPNSIKRVEELRGEGFGFVFEINHWSARDPEEMIKDTFLLSRVLQDAEMSAPVARHQWFPMLPLIAGFYGVETSRITTRGTIGKGKDFERPPLSARAKIIFEHQVVPRIKRQPVNHDAYQSAMRRRLTQDEMLDEYEAYLQTSAETLKMGGIVLIAPQAERQERMTEFQGGPLQNIVAVARENGVDKIAFVPIGIGSKKRTAYPKSGFNPFEKYTLAIGECVTLEEVKDEVKRRNQEPQIRVVTLDTVLQERLNEVVPDEYKRAA